MIDARRYQWTLALVVVLLAGAAFALGFGLQDLLGGDGGGVPRPGRDGLVQDAAGRGSRFTLLDEVYDILDRDFVEPDRIQVNALRTAAINGVVASLNDPHSVYLDAETYRLSSEDIGGAFDGIGATVNDQNGEIFIASVFKDSPAQKAGLRVADVILAVDGQSTAGWSLQVAVARIRGERGTTVRITVRHRTGVEETLTIVRDRIIVPSVSALPLQDREGDPVNDLAYVIIRQYTSNTRQELVEVLEAVRAGGYRGLIVDLRGNPGGLLTATIDTTGEFLDGGVVLTEVDRDGQQRAFTDADGGAALEIPLVLLVDGGSASGAEVMAAALRDHGRAVIIGDQTLGKGTVNVPRRLSDGSVLYVSTARWLTPNGDLIEGVGVIPDLLLEPSDAEFTAGRDVQLYAAIEFLRTGQLGVAALPPPARAE